LSDPLQQSIQSVVREDCHAQYGDEEGDDDLFFEERLDRRFRELSRKRGLSMSAFLAEAGRAALRARQAEEPPPFELLTYGNEGLQAGVDLDRPNALMAAKDGVLHGK